VSYDIEIPGEVLDQGMVSALRAYGPEKGRLLRSVAQDFVSEAPVLVAEIERAVDDRDLDAVMRIAHQMKGVSGHMGATRLAALADDLETSARTGRMTEINSVLATARTELERAIAAALALA
jgi:HPt (histidine-containing phosphotransfer) domain-containing protein